MHKRSPLQLLSILAALSLSVGSSPASMPAKAEAGKAASATIGQSVATAKAIRELIGAVLTAYGGIDKLRQLDNEVCLGKGKITEYSSLSQAANTFDCDMVSKGDKIRIEINVMGQKIVTAFDGKHGWTKQGDQVFPADPATIERIQTEVRHSLQRDLINLGDPKSHVTMKKPCTVMDKLCDQIEVTGPDGLSTTMSFDKKSHLVLSSQWIGSDSEQGIRAAIVNEFQDYRPSFGTMEPYRVVEYTAGKKSSESVQESITIDNSIDESIFDMPAEPEIARLKQGPVTIPFDYDGHQILIKCRINKTKTCVFVTDTGASQSIIDQNLANTLGQTQNSGYNVTTGSGSVQMNYMNLSSLELGDLSIENIPIGVMDGKAFGQMQGIRPDGLIGANLLKRFLVTIDYEKKQLILQDPRSVVIPPGAAVVATKPAMGNLGMVIEGKLDGKLTVPFLVDTGAAFNNISPTLIKPILSDPLLKVGKVLGMDGKQIDVGAVRIKSLQLGDLKVPDPNFVVALTSDSSGGGIITSHTLAVLGNPFWSHFRVTIDYRNNRLILEQSPERKALDALQLQLRDTRLRMLKSKNYDAALQSFHELASECERNGVPAGQALCLTEAAYARSLKDPDKDGVKEALADLDQATHLANQAGNEPVQARVLVRYIGFAQRYLKENIWSKEEQGRMLQSLLAAKQSVNKAVAAAPSDPEVLCALSMLLSSGKPDLAEKGFDQALAYDPSNWDALWGKYDLAKSKNDGNTMHLVELQLKRYYPGVPNVETLAKTTSQGTTSGAKANEPKP